MKTTKTIITLISATLAMSISSYAKDSDKPDKKGKVSAEMREAMKKRILARFDADQDGTLSDAEKATAKATISAERKEIRAAVLKQFDADGDGNLSETEREGVREWVKANYPNAVMMKRGKDGKGRDGKNKPTQ